MAPCDGRTGGTGGDAGGGGLGGGGDGGGDGEANGMLLIPLGVHASSKGGTSQTTRRASVHGAMDQSARLSPQ